MLRSGRWLAALVLVAIAVALALALRESASAPDRADAAPAAGVSAGLDLAAAEAAGGHTLARHVGKDDAALARRLAREPNLAAASSFLDRIRAEHAVAAALERERRRVETWARGRGEKSLVLRWRGDGEVVGRVLERGATSSVPAEGARVVLRRKGDAWFVLTAYPEVR